MAKQSAGILVYRFVEKELQVLLVHPGGPFFARKDIGAWSIPKGEFTKDEDALLAAKREIQEELGYIPSGVFIPLSPIKQKAGKTVHAWAIEGNLDPAAIVSNTFSIEWPPRSGHQKEFPEVDKAAWFTVLQAMGKINENQAAFIYELQRILGLNN